jgi:hypothetical protein
VIRAQKSGSFVASVIKVQGTDLETAQGLLQSSFTRWQLSDIMRTPLPRGSEVVLLVLARVLVRRPDELGWSSIRRGLWGYMYTDFFGSLSVNFCWSHSSARIGIDS